MFKRIRPLPSIERLRSQLDYDPLTGIFRWKVSHRGIAAGKIAGHISPLSGYCFIRVDGALIRSHRMAWVFMVGVWPTFEIDHRDRDRGNCRFSNLREATRTQNAANVSKSRRNTTGFTGVSLTTSRNRFRAEISVARKRIHIGYFDTARSGERSAPRC